MMRTAFRTPLLRLATCLLLGAGAHSFAGRFEVLPLPLLDHDLGPEQQFRVDRSSVPIPPRQLPPATALPRIPWLEKDEEQEFWNGRDPHFDLADFHSGNRSLGWLALTDHHFLLHVEVNEEKNENRFAGADLRRGDSLWVLFDAWGDDQRHRPYLHAASQRDWNALWVTALTGNRSHCRRERLAGNSAVIMSGPSQVGHASRRGRETVYELRIPWKELGVTPGVVLHSALAIRTQDSRTGTLFTPGQQWGGGAPRQDRLVANGIFERHTLSTLQRVLFDPPSGPRAWATVSKRHLLQKNDYGEIVICTNRRGPLFAEVKAGPDRRGILLEDSDPELPWRRYAVRWTGSLPADGTPLPFSLSVEDPEGEITSVRSELVATFQDREKLSSRIARLQDANNPDALFKVHLQGLAAADHLARNKKEREEARDLNLLSRNGANPVEQMQATITSLEGASSHWGQVLRRSAPFTLTVHRPDSHHGMTCEVWLPSQRKPGELPPAILWIGDFGPGSPEESDAFVIHVHPTDLPARRCDRLASLALLVATLPSRLPIARDRLYLGGRYSDIGALAAALPDRFAAIGCSYDRALNLFPGEDWDLYDAINQEHQWFPISGSDASRNRTFLPAYFLGGDRALRWHELLFNSRKGRMRKGPDQRSEVWSSDDNSLVIANPGGGGDGRATFHAWWRDRKRTRPTQFHYLKIHDTSLATWGIRVERTKRWQAYHAASWPAFECRIDGQAVHLTTRNCGSITIDPGPAGLQMEGQISLLWNGNPAYRGPVPPEPIKLK